MIIMNVNEMDNESGYSYVEMATENFILENITLRSQDDVTNVDSTDAQAALYNLLIPYLGCLIIVTNLAVTLSSGLLLKKGVQPKATYLFLGNIAMADLLTGVAALFRRFYPKTSRTHLTCIVQIGMIVSSVLASTYTVCLIAIDRFLYIVHGLNYSRWVYPTRARLLILFTWFLGLIIGFLPITGWSGSSNNGRSCTFVLVEPPGLIILITIIGLLPILLVLILYGIILYHAIRKVTQLQRADAQQAEATTSGSKNTNKTAKLRITRGGLKAEVPKANSTNQKRRSRPSKIKAIKVVLLTSGCLAVTWIPYLIACCVHVSCDDKIQDCETVQVALVSPLACLGLLNSLLNPIIYAWWHKGFREFLRSVLCRPSSSLNESTTSGTKTFSSRFQRALAASRSLFSHGSRYIKSSLKRSRRLTSGSESPSANTPRQQQ